jgi:mannosyl-oligosaccharide alpha-1,2-mannosidase
MSNSLPYSRKDVDYDNAKFRHRSFFKVITQSFLTSNRKRDCISCSTGKFLFLILIFGVAYLVLTHDTIPSRVVSRDQVFGIRKNEENNSSTNGAGRLKKFGDGRQDFLLNYHLILK